MRTYCDDTGIYSVDMMIAYVNMTQLPIIEVKVSGFKDIGWANREGVQYSVFDVLINSERYRKDYIRIENADLTYPIILREDKSIVDGVHRLAKASISGIPRVRAHVFPDELMLKFKIAEADDWVKADSFQTWKLIAMFHERF
jgi:hypothetical protein